MPDAKDVPAQPTADDVGKGAQKIRLVYPGDVFEYDKNLTLTGDEFTEVPANKVSAVLASLKSSRVDVLVEGK